MILIQYHIIILKTRHTFHVEDYKSNITYLYNQEAMFTYNTNSNIIITTIISINTTNCHNYNNISNNHHSITIIINIYNNNSNYNGNDTKNKNGSIY